MAWIFRHRSADGNLDTNTTMRVVSIVAFILLLGLLAILAIVAAIYQMRTEKVLEPSDNWITVLNSILLFIGAVLGIAGGVSIGKRATANADMVEVLARQTSGVAATPPAVPGKNLPRNSAPVETVKPTQSAIRAEAAPTARRSWLEGDDDGRTTAKDDPARGMTDDGERL